MNMNSIWSEVGTIKIAAEANFEVVRNDVGCSDHREVLLRLFPVDPQAIFSNALSRLCT